VDRAVFREILVVDGASLNTDERHHPPYSPLVGSPHGSIESNLSLLDDFGCEPCVELSGVESPTAAFRHPGFYERYPRQPRSWGAALGWYELPPEMFKRQI